ITMAEASWFTQDFELGDLATKKAVELAPADPSRRMLRGRLALAAYGLWQGDEAKSDAAEGQWQAAVEAYEKAIALCGDAPDASLRAIAQQAWTQLGMAYVWKQQLPDASSAFGRAIALDPATADYASINSVVQGQDFLDALAAAHKSWGAKNSGPGDATLVWWLGNANYGIKKLPEAEKAFESALKKNPEFWTSLYYLYRIHFEQRDYAKCLEVLHRYPPVSSDKPEEVPDRGGLVAALAYDVPGNAARLEALVGWAMDDQKHDGKPLNMEAAFASDLITRIVPREPEYSRHWNNLGLFLRDEGDRLRGTQGALEKAPAAYDEALVNKLWEESLAAYEVALEIEPHNPNYLNDTAVMLHYYFVRDLERAKAMYQRGYEEAKLMLERKDLSEDTRAAVKIALRDTGNNVKLVAKLIEKRAAEAAAPKGETPLKQ
ncbi:MAG: tetratricopeptide repeat protein, partial [Planctomycetota bacterium]